METGYVLMDEVERREMLQELTTQVKYYPFVPVFKDEAEARSSLDLGWRDFIVDVKFWTGTGGPVSILSWIRPTPPWDIAEEGYLIRAVSLDAALADMNDVVSRARPRGVKYIYFRIQAPGMSSHVAHVDTDMEIHRETVAQYQAGRVRRDHYDI